MCVTQSGYAQLRLVDCGRRRSLAMEMEGRNNGVARPLWFGYLGVPDVEELTTECSRWLATLVSHSKQIISRIKQLFSHTKQLLL